MHLRRRNQFAAVQVLHAGVLAAEVDQQLGQVVLVLHVLLALLALHLEERRLGDVDVARLDQLGHLPVQEGEDQGADVAAVHVGVGHDDDAVVAGLLDLELVAPDASADGGDHGLDFIVAENLVQAGLLDVEHLAAQRQDGLRAPVAPLLGGTTGGIPFHDVQLALRRVALGTVGQLARQRSALQRALAAGQLARLAGGLARGGGEDGAFNDLAGDGGILLQELPELLVDDRADDTLDLAVAQLGLGLALELRLRHLHAHHGRQALADVVAGHLGFLVLHQLVRAGVGVHRAGQRAAEAAQVRATLVRVDVVGVGEERLVVMVAPLERDLHAHSVLLLLEVDDLGMDGIAVAVDVRDELADAALVMELLLALRKLLAQGDVDALVQEGQLAQPVHHRVPVELQHAEDLGVGREGDLRAGGLGLADHLQLRHRVAALETHVVDLAVAADLGFQPLADPTGRPVQRRQRDASHRSRQRERQVDHRVEHAFAREAVAHEHPRDQRSHHRVERRRRRRGAEADAQGGQHARLGPDRPQSGDSQTAGLEEHADQGDQHDQPQPQQRIAKAEAEPGDDAPGARPSRQWGRHDRHDYFAWIWSNTPPERFSM